MQQDNNNIENKLRQLENQQLPDLSHMDEHWKGMQAMLQPPALSTGNFINGKAWFWALLAAGLVSILVVVLTRSQTGEKKNENVIAANKEINTNPLQDSISSPKAINISNVPTAKQATVLQASKKPVGKSISIAAESVSYPVFKEKNTARSIDTVLHDVSRIAPNRQQMLSDLLTQLSKQSETFTINNNRDNLLSCKEGTSLFIPANSLGGADGIVVSVKEFYRRSDMAMDHLSTTSNNELLVSGGMLYLEASLNGRPLQVIPGSGIRVYIPGSANEMQQMQLFLEEKTKAVSKDPLINWIPQTVPFSNSQLLVRVLDLRNEPYKVKNRSKGDVAYFSMDDDSKLSKAELEKMMKDKFGYYKVKLKQNNFFTRIFSKQLALAAYSGGGLGDSIWLDKKIADQYGLTGTQMRIVQGIPSNNRNGNLPGDILKQLQDKYSVDISKLGWINSDRFYNSLAEKINYTIELADSSINYCSMMVFDRMKSMLSGSVAGTKVMFSNVPVGEPVKIVSIGINNNGRPVFAMKETVIKKEELSGLQFEETSASLIQSSLGKMDK